MPANPPPPAPMPNAADQAIAAAQTRLNEPYQWGGPGDRVAPTDCSGLIQWAYGRAGVSLPRTSGDQYAATLPDLGPGAELPGDLLFWGPGGSQHVAMVVAPGMMIEDPHTGAVVHITAIRGDYTGHTRPSGAGVGIAVSLDASANRDKSPDQLAAMLGRGPAWLSAGGLLRLLEGGLGGVGVVVGIVMLSRHLAGVDLVGPARRSVAKLAPAPSSSTAAPATP
jgi:hypothetical protein